MRWIHFPPGLDEDSLTLKKASSGVSVSTSIEGFYQTGFGFGFLWQVDVSYPPSSGKEAREFERFIHGLDQGINACKFQFPRPNFKDKDINGFAYVTKTYPAGSTVIEIDFTKWGEIEDDWRIGVAGKFGMYLLQNIKISGTTALVRIEPGLRNDVTPEMAIHLLPRLAMKLIPNAGGYVDAPDFQREKFLSLIEIPQETIDLNQIRESVL